MPRAIAHLAVIGLVFFSVMVGVVAAGSGTAKPAKRTTAFSLVGVAHGADGPGLDTAIVNYDLVPDPDASDQLLARRTIVYAPDPTPLPTPVAPPAPPAQPLPIAKPQPVVGNGMLQWPVKGVITTYFSSTHQAIDIAAPAGSPVLAADKGVVTWAGWISNGGGLQVAIDHGNGIVTRYDHLGSIYVSIGDALARGEKFAAVGCTGWCTGPHVHFEVIVNGVHVNPLRYL
jgi:murein DD-endopeptidase MepM/ murein hydrolase activator NlpD